VPSRFSGRRQKAVSGTCRLCPEEQEAPEFQLLFSPSLVCIRCGSHIFYLFSDRVRLEVDQLSPLPEVFDRNLEQRV